MSGGHHRVWNPEQGAPGEDWWRPRIERLYPWMRTSVGASFGRSLSAIAEDLPLTRVEISSGTGLGDWTAPDAWDLSQAYIEDARGRRWVDVAKHTLHVVNGSMAVDAFMDWSQLEPRLFCDARHPEAIPYRTSYYRADWGFCLSSRLKEEMLLEARPPFHVVIDSSRRPGHLVWGEAEIAGGDTREFWITAHLCHPSLANDNLSGVLMGVAIGLWLRARPRRWSYRVAFAPGTLGAIGLATHHAARRAAVLGGVVLAMVGDDSPLRYKRSRRGDGRVDQAFEALAESSRGELTLEEFTPDGYDERQFNSLGVDWPVGRVSRADYRSWPRYHCSLDSLEAISYDSMDQTFERLCEAIERLEAMRTYRVIGGLGEPQFGRRGLWESPDPNIESARWRETLGWCLAWADGEHSPGWIARKSRRTPAEVELAIDTLLASGLLEVEESPLVGERESQFSDCIESGGGKMATGCGKHATVVRSGDISLLARQLPAGADHGAGMVCRLCGGQHLESVVDLGKSPLCESYLSARELQMGEVFYPLHAFVCPRCWLVQLDEFVSGREIFRDGYAYFSSYSESWVDHARRYAQRMIERLRLSSSDLVIEVASNDGYLLQHFAQVGIPVLGIEPAGNCAADAERRGVPTLVRYLDVDVAREVVATRGRARLVAANNVLAHVPDLRGFVRALGILLSEDGTLTIEVQHLETLISRNQFDTIYHEHFCYFSLHTLVDLFAREGMVVFDAELLPTHGGSVRVYVAHRGSAERVASESMQQILASESESGLTSLEGYRRFQRQVHETKWRLLGCLMSLRRSGARVAGYGAPGKGNTLLNFCGIRRDLLDFVVDRNPHKQGRFLPGTQIPVREVEELERERPEHVLILPWNLRDEIAQQLEPLRHAGTTLWVPIPEPSRLTSEGWVPWKECEAGFSGEESRSR